MHQHRILLPQARSEWREPSEALSKDTSGNATRETTFRLTARLDDGHVVWRGWFQDREEADAFLWALASGGLQDQPALWRMPTPAWHPGIVPFATYEFATLVFLTGVSGSDQNDTVATDWTNNNSIEVVSHGANGDNGIGPNGGGGGAYAKRASLNLVRGSVQKYRLRDGNSGSGVGNASWYGGTSLATSFAGVQGASGGLGAPTTSGIGDVLRAGGVSGNGFSSGGCCDDEEGGGGGGAAGPNGVGGAGGAASGGTPGTGGTADGGLIAGGVSPGGNGNAGTAWDATHGPGSGGAGASGSGTVGGSGALYGAGGGGAQGGTGGVGKQAIIVKTHIGHKFVVRYIGGRLAVL